MRNVLDRTHASRWSLASGRGFRKSHALGRVARVVLALDIAVMLSIECAVAVLRLSAQWFGQAVDATTLHLAGPLILVGWIAVIAAFGGYRTRLFGAGSDEYRALVMATLTTAGLTAAICYLTRFELSRGFFVLVFALGSLALVLERVVLRQALHRGRANGHYCQDIVIAGTPRQADEIGRVLSREPWLGYRVVGAVMPEAAVGHGEMSGAAGTTPDGIPVLGCVRQATAVLDAAGADVIFVAGGALEGAEHMRELIWELKANDIQIIVAPNLTEIARDRVRIRPVAGLPLVHVDPPRYEQACRMAKRLSDLVLTSVGLVLIAPVVLSIVAAVKLHDGGPVFFRHVRVGRDGRVFSVFKFRTMVVDAEARLAEVQQSQGFVNGRWKMKDDPRITAPGRWLRRFSLDELPQLLNVLRGDMSLVGPRPMPPDEVELYDEITRRRLTVRPGITGLWQVSGRSDLSWSDSMRLDLYYVDNWSMVQDLMILFRTIGAVATSRGAY